jgi:hypothetical protein
MIYAKKYFLLEEKCIIILCEWDLKLNNLIHKDFGLSKEKIFEFDLSV